MELAADLRERLGDAGDVKFSKDLLSEDFMQGMKVQCEASQPARMFKVQRACLSGIARLRLTI